ncbi:hypothetical protein [Phenylobacterium sp.]|uniref:hypothetical protein n=1 Tax=Phenylobacterium sp. TaxID=1871053 RepID=UPI001226928F|nr:hypothetical protein [Phenylobacterium sp.]THD62957.1 MAG: hypothetical protein E8A49_06270 [Phenylobacterium sp.]
MNARPGLAAAKLLASLCVCGLAGACITAPFHDAKVDPRSPIAAEVARTVRPDAPFPTFVNFPKKPTDVRPHRQYGYAAAQVELDAAAIVAGTADSTWTLSDTEAFAMQARADAGPELPPPDPADTAAFAKDQRARATPPPPPKR